MTEQATEAVAAEVAGLITRYGFELNSYTLDQWIDRWLRHYPMSWLRPAVVEALYQGRYKVISVTQILELWQRRGRPLHHFNREFERIICNEFPRVDLPMLPPSSSSLPSSVADKTPPLAEHPQTPSNKMLPSWVLPSADRTTEPPTAASLTAEDANPFRPMVKRLEEVRLRAEVAQQPIHQFIPTPEPSDFYSKLKSVVYSGSALLPSEHQVAPEDEALPPGS
ncbi:MAG: hypothetical protein IGS50_00245 [Synechococcales cyanobacterium C42_A2020_086]|jgi:hypothetical protein|nr:hypothetical protein [Synechococcales cyanobacterium C42_A2020_086]